MSEDKISRRRFLGQAAAAAAAAASLSQLPFSPAHAGIESENSEAIVQAGKPKGRPNIVFILADDLGWADLSIYGRSDYRTRTLDKFAGQGVRLTHAYSNSSVCTPTRVAFFTGRYQQRLPVGLQEPLDWAAHAPPVGLPSDHPTIASRLRDGGYHTALVGKWHVGYLPGFSPLKSGFDEFFGIYSGGVDYFTHQDGYGDPDLWEDETPVDKAGYITDLITDRALEVIAARAKARDPFYLSVHYTAPHWPWEGPKDEAVSQSLKSLFHLDGGSPKIYAELVQRLDYGVGRILNALDKLGLADNTIVVFTSDNGGERFSNEWPFIGSKGSVYEGSNRVPAILRWPGVLPKNKLSRQAAITFDWTATLLAAAKISPLAKDPYPLDGIDLLPYLQTAGKGESTISRQLFWRIGKKHAVRAGDLKYIKFASPDQVLTPGGLPAALRGTEFLFDLSQDPREQANLLEKRPDDVTRLKAAWDTWNATVLPEPS